MFRTIGFRFSGTAVSPHKNIQEVGLPTDKIGSVLAQALL